MNDINECDGMDLSFNEASGLADIQTISQLAEEIWHDHYRAIIGAEQVTYMLARFQNVNAIRSQIASGYRYYLVCQKTEPLAYFAIVPDAQQRSLQISKLYVRAAWQRKGLGSRLIAFIEGYYENQGFEQIWLTVNRHNRQAIDFYRRNKFINAGGLVQEIGGGFVMDDFKMVKNLSISTFP